MSKVRNNDEYIRLCVYNVIYGLYESNRIDWEIKDILWISSSLIKDYNGYIFPIMRQVIIDELINELNRLRGEKI